jgi:hypothetical protein
MTMPVPSKLFAAAFAAFTFAAVATTEATADAGEQKMNVKRLVLAHGIDGHEPQQPTTTFQAKDDRVYAFVEVANPTKVEGKVLVVFEPPSGPALAPISLDVKAGSPRFRTWAFTRRAHEVGDWAVVIRDTNGRLLARETFKIEK